MVTGVRGAPEADPRPAPPDSRQIGDNILSFVGNACGLYEQKDWVYIRLRGACASVCALRRAALTMRIKRKLAVLVPLLTLAAVPITRDPVRELAGHYSVTFPNALVTGEKYTSENIIEIYPVSRDAAYVRAHTEWANGHSCSLWGVAATQRDRLVYREPMNKPGAGGCVLSIRRLGGNLRMNDESDGGCQAYCGARGTFREVDLPFSSRRPITYGARLRGSWQFKEAMADWQNGRPPRETR
jgi:hypothetical protein